MSQRIPTAAAAASASIAAAATTEVDWVSNGNNKNNSKNDDYNNNHESSEFSSERFSLDFHNKSLRSRASTLAPTPSSSSPPPPNNNAEAEGAYLEIETTTKRCCGSNNCSCSCSCCSTNTTAAGVGLLLEQVLFFLAGLGSSIGYIATLSSLVYFKVLFGANSFVYLNCAVYLPLLPISVAQAIWDSQFDLLWQSKVTFLVRGVLGYGFVIAGTLGMMAFANRNDDSDSDSFSVSVSDTIMNFSNNDRDSDSDGSFSGEGFEWVIGCALLQGIGGAVLFGQLNQLASFVGSLHQNNHNTTTVAVADITTDGAIADNNLPFSEHLSENEALPKKFKATVSAGVQASAFVVLFASVSSGFGTATEEEQAACFCDFLVRILQVEALCFAAFLWLLMARPRIQVSMMRRDTSMRELTASSEQPWFDNFHQQNLSSPPPLSLSTPWEDDPDSTNVTNVTGVIDDDEGYARLRLPLLQNPSSPGGSNSNSNSSIEPNLLSLRALLYHSRMACLGMALTLVPSFLIASWFTRVQTNWMELAQVLFYVRIGSDLTGRFFTVLIPPPSIECVVLTAGLRCIAVVVFFANASSRIPLRDQWDRDALSIGLVSFVAFCSGYLVTSCYQLAPQQLPGTSLFRSANVAKQSSLLTVAFSVSAIVGLVTSFVLVAIGV